MASPATAFGSITETDGRRGVPVTSVAAAAAALQLPVAEVLDAPTLSRLYGHPLRRIDAGGSDYFIPE